jgi:hypothetical protein
MISRSSAGGITAAMVKLQPRYPATCHPLTKVETWDAKLFYQKGLDIYNFSCLPQKGMTV